MKILVFSDTHGNPAFMQKAVADHMSHGGVDVLIHLGDGWRDFADLQKIYPDIPSYAVKGNCDEWSASCKLPPVRIVELGGLRFYLTHGHHSNVKNGLGNAAASAAHEKATVLLYGHTHLRNDSYEDTVYGPVHGNGRIRCINPGSAGAGYAPSYATLELVNGQLLCGFGVM